MLADLAILAKFRQIRLIGPNYANDFNRCHPAMMVDLADLAILVRYWHICALMLHAKQTSYTSMHR